MPDRARMGLWAAPIDRGPGGLLDHYMETGMLLGIKERVEVARGRSLEYGTKAADVPLPRRLALASIRAVHTLIFAVELTCVGWLIGTGATGRRDRTVGLAAGLVVAEAIVWIGNDRVCPLTPLAERLGAGRGSVSDIFLPDVVARTLPIWFIALLAVAAALHVRSAWPAHGPWGSAGP